jgi:hypothetical protein
VTIEVRLKKKELDPKTKETQKDGVHNTMRAVLFGRDKDNDDVEWTVTLKYKGDELPKEYMKALGKHWSDEVIVTLGEGSKQTTL